MSAQSTLLGQKKKLLGNLTLTKSINVASSLLVVLLLSNTTLIFISLQVEKKKAVLPVVQALHNAIAVHKRKNMTQI